MDAYEVRLRIFWCYGRGCGSGDRIGCAPGLVNGNTDATHGRTGVELMAKDF